MDRFLDAFFIVFNMRIFGGLLGFSAVIFVVFFILFISIRLYKLLYDFLEK